MNMKIGDKTLHLDFTLSTMEALEKYRGKPLAVQEMAEELKKPSTLVDVLMLLSDDDSLTAEWLKKHIRPGQIPLVILALFETITVGMKLETVEGESEGGVVDVTLE